MVNSDITSRAEIMDMLKVKFGSLSFWTRIESDLALFCSELPEPIDKEKREDFIRKLKLIKDFLFKQSVPEEDLKFIDDEIELHEQTKMISLYEEKDDSLDPSVVSGYSRLGKGCEGLVAIPQSYNYTQLSKLTNGVFKETGLVKFYISQEKTLYGKITAEIYDYAQEIPIATVVEKKKKNIHTGENDRSIKLFGQKSSGSEVKVIKEINIPFYVYRFISEKKQDLILLTTEAHTIGDYLITGVETSCNDYKALTDSSKLPTKLPFFFAQKVKNKIIQFKNHEQFKTRLENLKVHGEDIFDYPFTVSKGNNHTYKLLQPTWYKWLIWAWLTHQPKGLINNYPMHILQLGVKMSGKSLMLNSLWAKSKEIRNIFSGSSSTLKSLVPSFKYKPAQNGYLAESIRFSFCDEFLRCLINTRTTKEGSEREESVAMMNDLLEWQKREAGSGVSKVNINMTSRIMATTNPIRNIQNVEGLIHAFDESFLSRWLIYYQTEDHVQLIRKSNDSELEKYNFKLPINDWISFLDYLHSFSSEYDLEKIIAIHNEIPNILSENLNRHYDARHRHHIECLMDGIIKARCLKEGDMSFKATEEDYKILKEVWFNVIRSWINPSQIKGIDVSKRIYFLPENCQYLFWKICAEKKGLSRNEVEKIALEGMSKMDYYEAWSILLDMGVIIEYGGIARPYYLTDIKDKNQEGL